LWEAIKANEERKQDGDAKQQEKKRRKLERSQVKKVYNLPRAKKLRVYPNKTERETLKQWFGVVRRAYNTAVVVHQDVEKKQGEVYERVRASAMQVKRDKEGRPIIKAKESKIHHLTRGWADAKKQVARQMEREGGEDWVLKVPQAIRDSGIRDMEKAVNSVDARNDERVHTGESRVRDDFKFRSRKDKSQTFEINARDFKATSKQGKLFCCMKKSKEGIHKTASCAVRVSMDKLGRVFLSFVQEVECKSETQAPTRGFHSTVALDPGVRTFQTIYDADGHGIEWGEGDMKTIFVLCRQADQIQSRISKTRATWSLRRAYHRKLRKIKDKVKECHNKLALFLCENFRVVLIPKFQVSRMIKKRNRKISSITVRQMCCWSHFAFREALIAKAALFPWCTIVEVGEAYTSKTCEECGALHQKLGSNKVFKCPRCNHTADRDLHAAKNILLRYITRENLLSEGW
jgi:transposase